ncbi:50S ribosomal protein L18 [archaeon]|nr:50S ribosomal protein L18 [archaeon]
MIKRRRKEGKTDYLARTNILKSEKLRIVFRKTNRYIIGQAVKSEEAQDKVLITTNSRELLGYGWPENAVGSLKSLPACYLTGFLLGKKISKKSMDTEAIPDIGLLRNVPKSRAYGFFKGVVDSGVKVKCNEESFPDEKRLTGENLKSKIKEFFKKIKNEIEEEK